MPATTAELTNRTSATVWWTAAETIGASQTSAAEGKPLTAGMPTTAETPTIVLASTGRPTATEMLRTVDANNS
jgi:hypothetical protein